MDSFTVLVSALLEFLLAVLHQWGTLSTGSLVVAVWALLERKNDRKIPWHVASKIFAAFLFWAVFLAWKDQRQANELAGRTLARQEGVIKQHKEQVAAEQQSVRNEQRNVRDRESATRNQETEVVSRDKQLNNRDAQLSNRDSRIEALQSKTEGQRETIDNLQRDIVKAQQSEPLRFAVVREPYSPAPGPGLAGTVTFLILTTRTVSPVHMDVVCKGRITRATGSIYGSGTLMAGTEGLEAPNAYRIAIEAPAWTPVDPLIVRVDSEKDKEFEPCNFKVY